MCLAKDIKEDEDRGRATEFSSLVYGWTVDRKKRWLQLYLSPSTDSPTAITRFALLQGLRYYKVYAITSFVLRP